MKTKSEKSFFSWPTYKHLCLFDSRRRFVFIDKEEQQNKKALN